MYQNFYTTAMCTQKKVIERRFTMIKTVKHTKKYIPAISTLVAVMMLALTIFTSGVLANALREENNVIINGKEYSMELIYVENTRYLHTDSYYVPLRATFEALGCTVNYNIGRSNAPSIWSEHAIHSFPDYSWRENLVVDEITSQIYGATISTNTNMPIIEIISSSGEKWYTQICSERVSDGRAMIPPPIIIDNKAYISIGTLAGYLIPEDEESSDSIFWDSEKHDRYYVGRLLFDEETQTLTINTSNKPDNTYSRANTKLSEIGHTLQRIENNKYIFAIIGDDLYEPSEISCAVVEKSTGKIAVIEDTDKTFTWYMLMNFETVDEITLTKTNDSAFYKKYNLSECTFN